MDDSQLGDDWLANEVALLGIAAGDKAKSPLQSGNAMEIAPAETTTPTAEMQDKNIEATNNDVAATIQNNIPAAGSPAKRTITCHCIIAGPNTDPLGKKPTVDRVDWFSN